MLPIEKYVADKWDETKRFNPNDEGSLIGLPYTYTVPTASGAFNEMYYWDTYFANKGLIIDGKLDLALNNCKNILFLVEKFGYMPNGSRTWFVGRSQPPYLAMMIDDLYGETRDKEFLAEAYPTLKKEYGFWATKRGTVTGLNRYYNEHSDKDCKNAYVNLSSRVKSPFSDQLEGGRNLLAEAESGWDFTPRFGGECTYYNPIDLNSNLYAYEKLLAKFERELSISSGEYWEELAARRKEKIDAYCWSKELGVYNDYDFVEKKISSLYSAACVWPYFTCVADNSHVEGLKNALKAIEAPYGVFTAEKTADKYQWGYPNVWAPCVCACVIGCMNYGLIDDAKRIAKKYILLVEKNYERTGGLWEKYNALDGTTECVNEYEMPQMMGWTAGVYKFLKKLSNDWID